MFLISDLCKMLETYLDQDQVQEVYRAYLFGAEAHEGQKRMSGEPYIYHPLAVARILAGLKMDHKTLMAAILHDVIEDTEYAKDQLANEFDEEVANLVDGVSKLTQIKFESKTPFFFFIFTYWAKKTCPSIFCTNFPVFCENGL